MKEYLTVSEKKIVEDYLEHIEELFNPSYKMSAFLSKLLKRQHKLIQLMFEELFNYKLEY